MIKKECWGLEVSFPKKYQKEIWKGKVPVIEELVSVYYWKDTGSQELQEKYKGFIKKFEIEYSGELDVESYKKEPIFKIGQLEWFWLEYPSYKRYSPEYRKDLKKLLFTCEHPQIKSYRDDWYLGIKKEIKLKKEENKKRLQHEKSVKTRT